MQLGFNELFIPNPLGVLTNRGALNYCKWEENDEKKFVLTIISIRCNIACLVR
jgi:hypothetical protein